MIMSRRVALNGTQLDSLDGHIVIRGVDTGVPNETIEATDRMGGFGQRITRQHWNLLDVQVRFAIDVPKRQLAARRQIYEAVCEWAAGCGWLTVNYMTGRRVWIEKAILPSSGDLWRWTDDFTIIFRAYGAPFWQDSTATTTTGDSITVPGNIRTVCDAEVTNGGSSTINSLTVTVGGSSLIFSSLGLAAGEALYITHSNDGLLQLKIKNTSDVYRDVYSKLRPASADDLYVDPGANAITVSAGTATVSCYGRYA